MDKLRSKLNSNIKLLRFLPVLVIMMLLLPAYESYSGTVTYQYDESDQILKESYDIGKEITYDYDDAGNLLSEEVAGSADTGINLTSPNGGERWEAGSSQTIRWTYRGNVGSVVEITLLKGGQVNTVIAPSAPVGDGVAGSYTWAIPADTALGSDYQISLNTRLDNAKRNSRPSSSKGAGAKNAAKAGNLNRSIDQITVVPVGYSDVSSGMFTIERGRSITVTSPNAGGAFVAGSTQTIEWTYSGGSVAGVRIELLKGGAVDSIVAADAPIGANGAGSYSWTIPQNQASGNDYAIRVTNITDEAETDVSDRNFTISSAGLTLTSPNGGETLEGGATHTIKWSYAGVPDAFLRIELLRGGAVAATIAEGVAMGANGAGAFLWTIPKDQPAENDYAIRIASMNDSACTDASDAGFTILPPGVTVTSPNGGETIEAGIASMITWRYVGSPLSSVKIELLKGGAVVGTVTDSTPIGANGSGAYAWTPPKGQASGNDYRIRVTGLENASGGGATKGKLITVGNVTPSDTSDGDFTIVATGITVASPNGGENWEPGSTHAISWTYHGNPGAAVKIELLKGGAVTSVLADGAPVGMDGAGSYSWLIPSSQPAGSDYRIRVSAAGESACAGASGGDFTIVRTDIDLASPVGGETWEAGATRTIAWNYHGNPSSSVNIRLMKGTSVIRSIASAVPIGANGAGSYAWAIPANLAAGNDYKIRIVGNGAASFSDTSNSGFSITPTSITLGSPVGGESWDAGAMKTIRWSYHGDPGDWVSIQLLKGGAPNGVIAARTPAGTNGAGSFVWTIPKDQAAGNDYTVKVSSMNGVYGDASPGAFTINVSDGIALASPVGGESWLAGTSQSIQWSYSGNPGTTVNIDLLKGGVVSRAIAGGVPIGASGAGAYSWAIPADLPPGPDYRIRVASASSAQCAGLSPADLSITNSSVITVASPIGGEILQAGSTQKILWTYAGSPGTAVKIELLTGGAASAVIKSSAPIGANGSGSFNWQIPSDLAARTDYRIRITAAKNAAYTDTSNGDFSVLPKLLTVASPNGGESWDAGAVQTIEWRYSGDPGATVNLHLLKGGVVNRTIAANVPVGTNGGGLFMWRIPASQAGGSDYSVRVTGAGNRAYVDASDGNFTIVPPSITVTSPNGGENFEAATANTITWDYHGDPGPWASIQLLKGGAVVDAITAKTPIGTDGSGSCTWTIPANQAPGNDYSVQVTGSGDSAYADASDSNFTITPTGIAVTSPNGGESFEAAATEVISWRYQGDPGASVKIELMEYWQVVSVIADSAPIGANGSGSYAWKIPPDQRGATDYTIRVTASGGASYADTSDATFNILPASIKVTSPAVGETWAAGATNMVAWSYRGDPGSIVTIELGKHVYPEEPPVLSFNAPIGANGAGSYALTVPWGVAEGDYYVSVAVILDGSYQYGGSQAIQITSPSIAVTSPKGWEPSGEWKPFDTWGTGQTASIAWTYTGVMDSSVKIELLKGGALYTVIASNADPGSEGAGSYAWTIPQDQETGDDYQVRVTSNSNPALSGASVGNFRIRPTGLTSVTVPRSWTDRPGLYMPIRWTYAGDVGPNVRIELLKDDVLVRVIAAEVPVGSNGFGEYDVRPPCQYGEYYRIRITCIPKEAYSGVSDEFSVWPLDL